MKTRLLRLAWICIGMLILLHSCGTRSYVTDRFDGGALFSTSSVSVDDAKHFRFAIVGDLHIRGGNTSRLKTILAQARSEKDEFVIFLGDIVDQGEEEDFIAVNEAIESHGYRDRFFPVIGNHDVFENGWEHYQKHFGPSRYAFTAGNAKFIVMDTADATVGEKQMEWLKAEAQTAPEHLFLASHYLPAVPGIRTYLKLSNDREALRLMKWADESGVRAWFGAHYHSFVVGKVGSVDYVVAGGGGGRRMEPVLDFFFVQVVVNGKDVSYSLRVVP